MWIFRLKRFFLENFSAKIILINLSPVRDEFWIVKCIIGQSKKWWKKKRKNEKENVILGWKPEKGSLEQKWENFQRLAGGANRRMKGQRSDSIRSIYEVLTPFKIDKSEPPIQESPPPNSRVYHNGSWLLSNCHIQEQKMKMNLFKMLDFQRIHFSKKGFKCATPLLNQFVQINLLSQIIKFQVDPPFGDF